MKLPTWPLAGQLLSKSIGLLAVLAIAACSSYPTIVTGQNASLSEASTPTSASTAPINAPASTLPAATQSSESSGTPGLAAASAPTCTAPAKLTLAVTEGPFYKAGSPERTSLLEAGITGTQLTLTGYVLTADFKPVAHAWLDFWQANTQGQYDNAGYSLRGHQYTDANGRYQLVTIDPGLYPGRTEHIHVKVQAPNGPILTTQLFFPGVSENQSDSIYDPSLLVNATGSGTTMRATFNFIISLK
jgi:protocatechuate 3,4-dioxygenase beta subunit